MAVEIAVLSRSWRMFRLKQIKKVILSALPLG
jgi:hypothetical protein